MKRVFQTHRRVAGSFLLLGAFALLNHPTDLFAAGGCIKKTRKLATVQRKAERMEINVARVSERRDILEERLDTKSIRILELRQKHVDNRATQLTYCNQYNEDPEAPENRNKVHSCHRAWVLEKVIEKLDRRIEAWNEARIRRTAVMNSKIQGLADRKAALDEKVVELQAEVAEACAPQ